MSFILDRLGRVIRANAAAGKMLGQALRVVGGRLGAADNASSSALERLVLRALSNKGVEPSVVPPAVLTRPGRRPLVVYAQRLPATSHDVFSGARVLVIVRDLGAKPRSLDAQLRSAFGLTTAEARLATHLAGGESLETFAAAAGIAVETSRNQLKAVFGKLDVHRQGELVALLGRLHGR